MSVEAVASPHPWLMPIASDAPAGRDARHEPEHESVRAEIQKLGSLQGGTVDWNLVEQVGTTLLSSKSKDLLIASYVAYALFERAGLAGCMEGLALLSNLLEHFGDSLHPLRPRARGNALEWFGTNLSQRLQDKVPDSLVQAEELRTLTRGFLAAVSERLGEHAPNLAPLRTAVDRLLLSAPVPEPVAPPPVVSSDGASSRQPSATVAALDEHALAAWLAPISQAQPGGDDTSYADEHVAVRDEIAKLENAVGAQPSWALIASGSDTLLRTRSKDLGLACYYAIALAETQGAAGLLLGLRIIDGILRTYWETLWPPLTRIKRRSSALEWLATRAPITIASWNACDAEISAALTATLADVEAQLAARFGASAPILRPLAEALTKLATSESASAVPSNGAAHVASDVPAANAAAHATSSVAAPAVVSAPQSSAELGKFLNATGDALAEASAHLRTESESNPRAYELLRIGVWLSIDSAPSADAQGLTRVPAPLARVREAIDGMVARQEWSDLLTQAEGSLARSPLWLDLQRYSALALTGLGASHAAALSAVEREARAFAARIPALLQLKFADGTPLAQPDTVRWLTPADARNQSSSTNEGPALPDGMSQRLICGEPAAIAELHELLRIAGSGRRSFALRLELATLLETTAAPDTVIALYLSLERDIDAHGLAQWEPALATEAFAGLRRVLRREAESRGGPSPELQRVCARLAQLTPGALL
jgi:type VI secretion system protein VasJ